jgi:ribonuclease HII
MLAWMRRIRLVAKANAAKALERERRTPTYPPQPIMLEANADPCQPLERTRRITRAVLPERTFGWFDRRCRDRNGRMPDFRIERALGGLVAGIDESGRGPWAGPVFAAAVILDAKRLPQILRYGLNDSKKLTAARRLTLFEALGPYASIGIGQAAVEEIDTINILQATMAAMGRALENLGVCPDHAIVDGNYPPRLPCPVKCVVRGDSLSLSVAAASIVAKVTRDRMMTGLAAAFPGYGWDHNFGYGTAEHQAALNVLGATCHHRRSFAPVLKVLQMQGGVAPTVAIDKIPVRQ